MKYLIMLSLTILADFMMAQANSFRQIYLFTPSMEDSSFIKQQQILAVNTEGVKERDVRISVFLPEPRNTTVYKKYKIPSNKFTFLLIGKDGGEKMRTEKIVSLQRLFILIDGMPMRQDEIRRKNRD